MPAKKKGAKGQKMSLGDFLNDGPSVTSWADDTMELPTAPMASSGTGGRSSLADAPSRKDLVSQQHQRRDYESHEPRAPVDFPTEPPFTAHVGNLPFTADEAALRDFFGCAEEEITTVRLITDRESGRLKGFGYVHFASLEALKRAVARDGADMGGRALRIGVSESRADDRAGGASTWRRADALLPEPATSPFGSRSSSGFGREPRELREPREPREPLPPSAAETVSDWRVHKDPPPPPVSADQPPAPPRRSATGGAGFGDRFSRSSSGAGPDASEEPRAPQQWRREGRAEAAEPVAKEPSPREPRRASRDRSASREPPRAPRAPTVAEQANTWRAAAGAPLKTEEPEAAEIKPAEIKPAEIKPEAANHEGEGEGEGWSHVEKPAAAPSAAHAPRRAYGAGFDRTRSASGRHREGAPAAEGADSERQQRSPRTYEKRGAPAATTTTTTGGGFFAARDGASDGSSWRR
ncbi:Eukaryotic translation initiation factor 4B [Coemansia thaxteri]|uniref:Eukaryotic translation initiation factor 4B n=1 Tax=Coemansia thaxteri TaxID=2663907 RepID=A0A9W8BPY7_9FUNG|nr:Eukaryotic translation initiation factor 4B [Coemansia thaxteri]KAJ2487712.1 Eukaryotic translation initiation factor 4B [Coemansia sp. RSA 2320]